MAARSISSFVLTFGLVAIPVKLYTAVSATSVGFNMLHKDCGGRLKQQLLCPTDEVVVERGDTVRGFEFAEGQYVKFTDEEIEALSAERDESLELLEYVPAKTVDHLQIEKTQYLGPGKGGDRAYQLLSLALSETDRVGVGRWKTRSKDTLVIVRPYELGLVMHQIYYATEVRPFGEIPRAPVTIHAQELALARRLVEQLAAPALDASRYYDTWAEKVMNAVEAKVKGDPIELPKPPPKPEVFDLVEALQRSLKPEPPPPVPTGKGVTKTKTTKMTARASRDRRAG